MAKRDTNIQFIAKLMGLSRNPMMQSYVFTAIEKYSHLVERLTEDEWNNELISLDCWKECAKEVLGNLDERFKNEPTNVIY